MDTRPFRSALYIPGSKARALEKATRLAADAIIFDLEDAVAPAEKGAARAALGQALSTLDYGQRTKLIRINALDTGWAEADLDALSPLAPEAIVLPKVNAAADVAALLRLMEARQGFADTRVWAMMETPKGALNAAGIADAPRMAGVVMGTNDLAKDLRARFRADRAPLMAALQMCLMAARASGLVAVDGVYNAFRDDAGLRAECAQGRDLGFDGKSLIHPAQLDIANEIFAPSEDEIALARRQIAAYQEARARGEGVAVVDGQIVENLHVETAKQALSRAAMIEKMKETM